MVCDLDRFEVHTNFTATRKRVYAFDLEGLAQPANLDVLRKLFTEPDALRPDVRAEAITRDAAERFGDLAKRLRMRKGVSAQRAAHFLMKLMFCMFGERIGLLPSKLFGRLLETAKANPAMLTRKLENLFRAMADGGDFGAEMIPRFNGGLFADNDVVPLTEPEINILASVNGSDWSNVEPSIFGTLFERHFDPSKESLDRRPLHQPRAILSRLVEPVVMAPLGGSGRRSSRRCDEELWPKVQETARAGRVGQAKRGHSVASSPRARRSTGPCRTSPSGCTTPRCSIRPAARAISSTWRSTCSWTWRRRSSPTRRRTGWRSSRTSGPTQLSGLEINPFAQQLAQVVIWIGYLQWMHHNGFKPPSDPVLEPIESIRCQDAILDLSDPKNPKEPEWPEAEFIVGNPPFLGEQV